VTFHARIFEFYVPKPCASGFENHHIPFYLSGQNILILSLDEFVARSPDELSLTKGDRIELIERDDDFGDGWFLDRHVTNGHTGLFPEGMAYWHESVRETYYFLSLHDDCSSKSINTQWIAAG